MCDAIEIEYCGQMMVVTAGVLGSHLPVLMKSGAALMIPWGRQGRSFSMRRSEQIEWPRDPWLRLEDVKAGAFADCQPRPARILARRFLVAFSLSGSGCEIDRWVQLEPGQFIQGCYFRHERDRAIYIVTTDPPSDVEELASPWPRIISASKHPVRTLRRRPP